MKIHYRIFTLLTLLALSVACVPEAEVDFILDTDEIQIGPEGGTRTVKVSASDSWYASTEQPWITVSPANGRGAAECKVMIDSSLTWNEPRVGTVYIWEGQEKRSFTVTQEGFDYQILLEKIQPVF